jgi:transcription termination/antitermination protein NusG
LADDVAGARWHAVWTRSNCEQLVHDHLLAKGFRPFLPTLDAWIRRHGHRYRGHVPMFPGYVFFRDVMDKSHYLAVSRVPGLVRVLGERWDRLAVVPDREIEAIQRVVLTRLPVAPHPYLRGGQRVRITAGPFVDIEGMLLRTKPNRGLIVVSIDMLQRSIAVEVDCTLVEPA